MLYRSFASQAEIDAEYNVGLLREDRDELERLMAALSDDVRRTHPHSRLGVRFGPTRAEHLDIFCAAAAEGPPRPVLVFIHGGYWAGGERRRLVARRLRPARARDRRRRHELRARPSGRDRGDHAREPRGARLGVRSRRAVGR